MLPRSASPSGGIFKDHWALQANASSSLWLLAHLVLPRALCLWDGGIAAQNMRRISLYAAPVGAACVHRAVVKSEGRPFRNILESHTDTRFAYVILL